MDKVFNSFRGCVRGTFQWPAFLIIYFKSVVGVLILLVKNFLLALDQPIVNKSLGFLPILSQELDK